MSINRRSRGYESYSDEEEDFDGYEKPLSRTDRSRMYRSENDLGKRVREISTQTLRETATQTGQDESVTIQSKVVVKKKRRPRSMSTSGTQTVKKESKTKSRSTDKLNDSDKDTEKKKRTKTKRSKSANALDALDTDSDKSEKPKPRPKPKPRKSTSADTHLEDQPDKSAKPEMVVDPNAQLYYPGSEGFAPQPYPSQGYPMMPPGYQGQQGIPLQQYPGYPMSNVPPGYPGYPQGQPMPPPMVNNSAPRQPMPKQRNRSNWEMLCEMTDGNRQRDDITETGSVASSVFTNNPGYHDYVNPSGNAHFPNQKFNNYPPPPSYPMATQHAAPDYENTEYPPRQSQPLSAVGKQSSWDTLKGLTEQSAPPPRTQSNGQIKNSRSESVV